MSVTRRRGVSRRDFLQGTAAAGAAAATLTLAPRYAFATPETPAHGDVIVVVFLRGGADGLNLVAPFQMPTYRSLRPSIRVKAPEEFSDPTGRAGLPLVAGGNVEPFELSGVFAMHPGMQALYDGPWTAGRLAIVHACGLPHSESSTRSHFEAQNYWERGSASYYHSSGFLNRYLAGLPGVDRVSAVGLGSHLQRSLQGSVPAFSMYGPQSFGVSGFPSNTRARQALTSFYGGGGADLVLATGANTLSAMGLVAGIDWNAAPLQPQNGAVYGSSDIGTQLREIARLIRGNVGLRAAAIDMGGWDTHDDMGAAEDPGSYFRQRARDLANGLAAFFQDLGPLMDEVTVLTLTEFGRTIGENGNAGTDHGRAGCQFVMGGRIRGGVYGSFPGAITDGPEGDLAVLNDYRRVVSEVLAVRGGASSLGSVFPTYTPQSPLGMCLA